MNKKLTLGLILFAILILVIIFTPPKTQKTNTLEGATNIDSTTTMQEEIDQNLSNIKKNKLKIQQIIEDNNNSTDTTYDITTTTAQLDYTSLENKSLHIQMIILSTILIISIIIAIIFLTS